jgi:copper chaperone CopZ
MQKIELTIDGMSCGHCVASVKKALEELPDVQVESVRIGGAAVSHDPARTPADTIVEAIEDAGYSASVVGR